MSSKWGTLQGVQVLREATPQALEDPEGDLKEGQGRSSVEVCGRGVDSDGEVREHRSVQIHLAAQC